MLQTIGQRVRAAREQHGISQAELARRLKASVNAINMLEQDAILDPRASRIIGVARELGVTTDYLLGMDAELPRHETQNPMQEATALAQPKRQRTRKAAPVV